MESVAECTNWSRPTEICHGEDSNGDNAGPFLARRSDTVGISTSRAGAEYRRRRGEGIFEATGLDIP